MISDISFIVIARNEAFAIEKCLAAISRLKTRGCELICIDSQSTDKTMAIMKQFAPQIDGTLIIQAKGELNAAVVRNIGILQATKKYILFLDGDTEISEPFLLEALGQVDGYSAVCGDIREIFYDDDWRPQNQRTRHQATSGNHCCFCGGTFLTRASVVKATGMFDTGLKVNEDVDYSIRLRDAGPVLWVQAIMGIHHTHKPDASRQIIKELRHNHPAYTGMMLRKHCTNPNIFCVIKEWSELFFGIPFYILFILSLLLGSKLGMIISGIIIISDIIYGLIRRKKIPQRIIFHYINPALVISGFFIRPKKPVYEYKIIQ